MNKPFLLAIRGKVISAFLLAFVAIVLAVVVTYFSFNGLLNTVDQLSSPNEKLSALHNLFQRITQLDHEQRAEAIKHPTKPYVDFIKESKAILFTIDTLRGMDWQDKRQIQRLNTMEEILNERSLLFLSYIKLKSNYIFNKKYSRKLDTLTRMLSSIPVSADTNVTTTKKKTITTTYLPPVQEKDNRSVLSRLFGKKKTPRTDNTRVEVQEELSVQVDTLSVAQQDSAYVEVGRIMKSLQEDQHLQNRKMLQRELELINATTILSNQLLSILHAVEKEELAQMRKNSHEASALVNTSITRIAIIIVLFLLGAACLVFFILTDVSKSNYYKEQLIDAKEKAEELSMVKQRFLANMSHEIRTPLQSIIGYAEQLQNDDGTNNKEALSAIHTSSDHLLHIVNEILDYSRIESGKFVFTHKPFVLNELIEEVSSGVRIQARQRALTFTVTTKGDNNVRLSGDAFRLRQILYNLLGNAIKFTEKGLVNFDIEINDYAEVAECIFRIKDSGIGIRPEAISKIFEQFEQADGLNSHYGGSGLGLTIVKALVEAQEGTLQVESVFGEGSVFTVTLMFKKALSKSLEHAQLESRVGIHSFKGKVLVVDDDPLILRLSSLIFKKYHIPFITFDKPEKVLEQKLDDDISLILLDIRMPKVSGVELCGELRKRVNATIRIVALTAHVLPEEHKALLQGGFDEILTKPFRESTLLALIGYDEEVVRKVSDEPASPDFTLLRKMTMGDDELFQSILTQFMEETKCDIDNLEKNLHHMELTMVREIVHKLSGRIAQMGVQKTSDRLRGIEEDLDKGRDAKSIIERIIGAIDEVKNLLKEMQAVVV